MSARRAISSLSSVVALALGATAPAEAEPSRTTSLGWTRLPGAESCIGTRALAEAVEARLHHVVLVPASQAEVAIEGRIEKTGDGWRATIAIADAKGALLGARELASLATSCAAMDDELALVIAVMIDPDAALAPPPARVVPPIAPPPIAPAATAPIASAPPMPPPIAAPRPSWRARLGAGPILAIGFLPAPSVGLRVASTITPPRFFPIAIDGAIFSSARATSGVSGATFNLAEAGLALCPLDVGAFGARLVACAGLEVGAIRAGGFGFDLVETHERPIVDVRLAGRAERRLVGPLALGGGLGLVAPTIRDTFYFVDARGAQREVFVRSPVGATLDIDLALDFP